MKNIVELHWIGDEIVKQIEQKFGKRFRRGRKNKLRKEACCQSEIKETGISLWVRLKK